MAKRMGLGRTQKLIEELRREIQLNGASFVGGDRGVRHITTGGAGTTVLGVEDSGKLILIDGSAEGNHTITLPLATVSSGLEFLIILKANSHGNTEFTLFLMELSTGLLMLFLMLCTLAHLVKINL